MVDEGGDEGVVAWAAEYSHEPLSDLRVVVAPQPFVWEVSVHGGRGRGADMLLT